MLFGERTSVAARSPLVLSGLVLAGANLPRTRDRFGITEGDGGILTAEAIAGLPLQGLELAVLSACDTGLGQVAGVVKLIDGGQSRSTGKTAPTRAWAGFVLSGVGR